MGGRKSDGHFTFFKDLDNLPLSALSIKIVDPVSYYLDGDCDNLNGS
jgi:hypothetical protein